MVLTLFHKAITNLEVRQEFLDSIDLEEAGKYVKRVLYIPNPDERTRSAQTLMTTKPGTLARLLHLKSWRSIIKVFPLAFTRIQNYNYFLSVLIDHEGSHARDFFYNPQLYSPNPFCFEGDIEKSEMEIRAFQNQLKKCEMGKRQISPKLEALRQMIEYHRGRIAGNLELMEEF